MKCPHCKKEIGDIKVEDTLGKILRRLNSEEFNTSLAHLVVLLGFSGASWYGLLVVTGLKGYALTPLTGLQGILFLILTGALLFGIMKFYTLLFKKLLKWEDPSK